MELTSEYVAEMIADGKSAAEIGEPFGKSKKAILRYALRHNLGPWKTVRVGNNKRDVPEGFVAITATMTRKDALRHWKCSTITFSRWMKQTGAKTINAPGRTSRIAKDALEAAYNGSISDTAKALGIDRDTASRHLRKHGIIRDVPQTKPKKAQKTHIKDSNNFAMKNVAYVRPQRDLSVIGQAVEFLRTLGPVSRCDESGKIIETGKFWRRGNAYPLTNNDVIERASSLGWRLVTV